MDYLKKGRPVNGGISIPDNIESQKTEGKILHELLFYQLCGIACYSKVVLERGENVINDVSELIEEAFLIIKGVKDLQATINLLKKSQRLKVLMRSMCIKDKYPNECEYNLPYYKDDMIRDSIQITLKKNNN
ncbi:MAG: hypothetical protein ACRC2K_02845, partial [Clostridium sp.]